MSANFFIGAKKCRQLLKPLAGDLVSIEAMGLCNVILFRKIEFAVDSIVNE